MLGELVEGTLRRLGSIPVVLAAALTVTAMFAFVEPVRFSVPDFAADEGRRVELALIVRGGPDVGAPVYRAALGVIASGVEADPLVSRVQELPSRGHDQATALAVAFEGSSQGEREDATRRIVEGMDPGPLSVSVIGAAAARVDAPDPIESSPKGLLSRRSGW